MATVNVNIYTGPYPSISNPIEIRIYAQSAPTAVLDTRQKPSPHLNDTWSFPGLPVTNYLFRIFEMDVTGTTIVQQLGSDMDVVPGTLNSVAFKATEQIAGGFTTGFNAGASSAVFDGTGGTEDWRGWDISTFDRIGAGGPLIKGSEYGWDKVTGTFNLLRSGDVIGDMEWFNVEFEPTAIPVPNSVPNVTPLFNTPKKITASYPAVLADMGGLLIIDPASVYLEVTLPNITTVFPGRLLELEMRSVSTVKCAKIKVFVGQNIDWLRGPRDSFFMLPGESIAVYRWVDPAGSADGMWRVLRPFGEYMRVGQICSDDTLPANAYNLQMHDGSELDSLQYARIYNEHILNLGAQAVNFDDWATGNNKYFYSLANSANPAKAGLFKVPDRRGVYERNTDGTRLPGTYEADQVGQFTDNVVLPKANSYTGGPNQVRIGNGNNNPQDFSYPETFNLGKENRVKDIAVRKYVIL